MSNFPMLPQTFMLTPLGHVSDEEPKTDTETDSELDAIFDEEALIADLLNGFYEEQEGARFASVTEGQLRAVVHPVPEEVVPTPISEEVVVHTHNADCKDGVCYDPVYDQVFCVVELHWFPLDIFYHRCFSTPHWSVKIFS